MPALHCQIFRAHSAKFLLYHVNNKNECFSEKILVKRFFIVFWSVGISSETRAWVFILLRKLIKKCIEIFNVFVILTIKSILMFITYMTKLLQFHRLRAVQLFHSIIPISHTKIGCNVLSCGGSLVIFVKCSYFTSSKKPILILCLTIFHRVVQ